MEDEQIPHTAPSDWQPMQDKGDLAALGKLVEELCECGAAIARCVIQGIDESEPTTAKINRAWLEDEIADVQAMIELNIRRFNLDRDRMAVRRTRKYVFKDTWIKALDAEKQPAAAIWPKNPPGDEWQRITPIDGGDVRVRLKYRPSIVYDVAGRTLLISGVPCLQPFFVEGVNIVTGAPMEMSDLLGTRRDLTLVTPALKE